ncbi:MAG: hypothetical protein NT178_18430 [Proteobacteria bacterium]|nr:hypothetical protein [Pseudomonadota bacterium]
MFWLDDDYNSPFNGADIYLEIDKFQDSCGKLNIKANDKALEAYDKHGLICPLYRINRPKDYLQTIFEQTYGPQDVKVVSVPDEHGNLLQFEYEELNRWHIEILPEFEITLKEGHPLDQAHKRGECFVEVPSKDTFKDWKEYELRLQMTVDGASIRHMESTARHFYAPWQIYLIEEANQWHTRTINVLVPLGENETYILSETPRKLSLTDWQEQFKSLWVYRFKESLLFRKTSYFVKENILEEDDAKRFYSDRSKIAETISNQHSYESWIGFLRTLCGLYFNYRGREKYKLSNEVKKDISETVSLLRFGLGKKYRDIINDVGMILGGQEFFYVPPLERIYPEYESFLRRETKSSLDSVLEDYNKEVPAVLKLGQGAVDDIIDHAFKIGNETLLVSVIGINKEYFSPSYFGEEGIWSYMRSLAVAVESWVKEIASKNDFRPAIVFLATGDFDSCCDQLQKKVGKTNMDVQSYVELRQFLDELKTVKFIKKSKDLTWMKYLIRAYLIRNYVAHHTKLEPELFGKNLIDLYRSLLFLVFFSWKSK